MNTQINTQKSNCRSRSNEWRALIIIKLPSLISHDLSWRQRSISDFSHCMVHQRCIVVWTFLIAGYLAGWGKADGSDSLFSPYDLSALTLYYTMSLYMNPRTAFIESICEKSMSKYGNIAIANFRSGILQNC